MQVQLNLPLPQLAIEGYPSPCNDELMVRLTLAETSVTSIRLYNIVGRVVKTVAQDATLTAGSHVMLARTEELPSGRYLLAVESSEVRKTKMVVVQH